MSRNEPQNNSIHPTGGFFFREPPKIGSLSQHPEHPDSAEFPRHRASHVCPDGAAVSHADRQRSIGARGVKMGWEGGASMGCSSYLVGRMRCYWATRFPIG